MHAVERSHALHASASTHTSGGDTPAACTPRASPPFISSHNQVGWTLKAKVFSLFEMGGPHANEVWESWARIIGVSVFMACRAKIR